MLSSVDHSFLDILNEPEPSLKMATVRDLLSHESSRLELSLKTGSTSFSKGLSSPFHSLRSSTESQHAPSCPFDLSALPSHQRWLPEVPARPANFEITAPDATPKRRSPKDAVGTAQLVHSLAQIELAAIEIDIALLFLYPCAPAEWHRDLWSIISDECRHFEMLTGLLTDWGSPFGTWPIHHGLWLGFLKGKTWLEHLVITTRFQEASGIDASHQLAALAAEALANPHRNTARLALLAPLIADLHADEIRHVAVGSHWWNFAYDCLQIDHNQRERDEIICQDYFCLVERRIRNPWSRRFPFYLEGRQRAGFSPVELSRFAAMNQARTMTTTATKGDSP